jgi:hypothetical protein
VLILLSPTVECLAFAQLNPKMLMFHRKTPEIY